MDDRIQLWASVQKQSTRNQVSSPEVGINSIYLVCLGMSLLGNAWPESSGIPPTPESTEGQRPGLWPRVIHSPLSKASFLSVLGFVTLPSFNLWGNGAPQFTHLKCRMMGDQLLPALPSSPSAAFDTGAQLPCFEARMLGRAVGG